MNEVMQLFSSPDAWLALITLTALEIVLGVDNIVFIAIMTGRLPKHQRALAYRLGLGGALVTRVMLLAAINWLKHLTAPLFELLGNEISGRDLVLITGGIFLIGKSSHEIYHKVEDIADHEGEVKHISLLSAVIQIAILDIVFSLDSVITAVGMADDLPVMVAAVVISIIVMLFFAPSIGRFVEEHPSIAILALSFLILIGVLLTAEGLDQHVSKGYVYFAMGFALLVELVNMRFRGKREKAPSQVDYDPGD